LEAIHFAVSKGKQILVGLGLMVFYATFNNISVISWWSVLLMEQILAYDCFLDKVWIQYAIFWIYSWITWNENAPNSTLRFGFCLFFY